MGERGKDKMLKVDPVREDRIQDEILVDCYGEFEIFSAWYSYLEDKLEFPFQAKCVVKDERSPLKVGEEVTVIDLINADDCEDGLYVLIEYEQDHLDVPLEQLKCLTGSLETQTAVEDWVYAVTQGYSVDFSSDDEYE